MQFKKVINEGQKIPKGYGASYINFSLNCVVCYLIGINVIIALFYRLYCYCAYSLLGSYIPLRAHNDDLSRLYKIFWRNGYDRGIQDCLRISKSDDLKNIYDDLMKKIK
jgi:hypothetical protein